MGRTSLRPQAGLRMPQQAERVLAHGVPIGGSCFLQEDLAAVTPGSSWPEPAQGQGSVTCAPPYRFSWREV